MSLSIISSSFIHVDANSKVSYLLKAHQYSIIYVCICVCVCVCVCVCACTHGTQIAFPCGDLISLGTYPVEGLLSYTCQSKKQTKKTEQSERDSPKNTDVYLGGAEHCNSNTTP
jgi:hypothetical protein